MIQSIVTRFRAYYLDNSGSSFSYFANGYFTVIEARMTETSRPALIREMWKCGVDFADKLHITSWDDDHCRITELGPLLELIKPRIIECPGYIPHSVNGEACRQLVATYRDEQATTTRTVFVRNVTPEYISSLETASSLAFRDVFHNPIEIDDQSCNDNSTIKHFRQGSFNVLSLGDVESSNIGARLRRDSILGRETDVMILAHHGADNGFTTRKFLRHLEPTVAICSSNLGNQYDHPRPEICGLFDREGIRLYTTKRGDVVIKSIGNHTGQFKATNLIGKNKDISSEDFFTAKKKRLLSYNEDTIRQIYAGQKRYP